MPELTKIQTGFLEPQGAFELDPGTASAPGLFFSGNTATGMFSPSDGVLGFSTGSTQNALTILADGKVGIGTTNPLLKLDVHGDSHVTGKIGIGTTDPQGSLHIYRQDTVSGLETHTDFILENPGSGNARFFLKTSTNNRNWEFFADDSDGAFGIYDGVAAARRFTILPSGNVGIGTTNPTNKFHVYNGPLLIESPAGDSILNLRNDGDGNFSGIAFTRERSTGTNIGGGAIFLPSDISNNSATLYIQTQSATNVGDTSALTDNNGVRLKLASQPNGVGSDSAFTVEVGATEKFRVTQSGNIGIGQTSPDTLLHITGDKPKLRIESTNTLEATSGTEEIGRIEWEAIKTTNRNVAASIRVRQDGTWSTVTPWIAPTAMEFYTQDYSGSEITSPRVTIDQFGKVGIGTVPTPGSNVQLIVQEDSTTTYGDGIAAFYHYDTDDLASPLQYEAKIGSPGRTFFKSYVTSSSADFLIQDQDNDGARPTLSIIGAAGNVRSLDVMSNGNIGIGTTLPTAKFEIRNGHIIASYGGNPANVSYGGRSIITNIDVQTTSFRSGVVVRNMNDFRALNENAGFQALDAYDTAVDVYAFRAARGATLVDKFWVKTGGDGYFAGGVTIDGALSKGSGSFKINHPLPEKTSTHYLVHSFVESPQANNIYRGKTTLINGQSVINLDEVSNMTEGTFESLNRDIHCFTTNETDWDNVKGSVEGNILTITCQNPNSSATISWLVIGERQDKHMYDTDWTDDNGKVIVEPLKESL